MLLRSKRMGIGVFGGAFVALTLASHAFGVDAGEISRRLYAHLTGVSLSPWDARAQTLEALVAENKLGEAAHLITDDPNFLDITVRDFAMVMSNRELSPYPPLNDFVAMVVGVARDETDARELLSGDFRYVGLDSYQLPPVSRLDNKHYEGLEQLGIPLKTALRRAEPQWPDSADAGGLLTSRAWGMAHMIAGTNRRALQYAFQELLCRPILTWKDTSIADDRVRCDVTRAPSGNPQEYQANCRGCHGPMDAMAGAFAAYNVSGTQMRYLGPQSVANKMVQNGGQFPYGFITVDSSWKNYLSSDASFGWHGPNEGTGVHSLGTMLAASDAFTSCMAQRAFKQVCHRSVDAEHDGDLVQRLAQSFEAGGYKLRSLFEAAAVTPECLQD